MRHKRSSTQRRKPLFHHRQVHARQQAGDAADGGAVPFLGAVGELLPGNEVGASLGVHVLCGAVVPAGLRAFL